MKIYFGASVSFGRDYLKQTKKIVEYLKKQGHQILSEYVVDPKLKVGDGLDPKSLFKRETQNILKADLMIAEVTQPSWGTAFLMEHALDHQVPVLALFYKNTKAQLPMMIEGHPDLYVAHYNQDNLKTVLRKNLNFFETQKTHKGKLVVIDGTNGSGKTTQSKMLLKYFKDKSIKHKHISFPRYYSSFHGQTVGRFLNGEFGGLDEVNPHLSSLAYALDRLTARDEIVDWLKDGNVVLADRYVTSSMAFQAAKVPQKERKDFLRWVYQMEYQEHKMPKEDAVVYLYVPPEISDKLILNGSNKKYRGKKKKDIEEDLAFQKKVVKQYLGLCESNPHWVKINCVNKKGELLSKKAIHKKVLKVLRNKKII